MKHLKKFNEAKENKENDIIKNLDSDLSKIRKIISWASEEGSKKAFYEDVKQLSTDMRRFILKYYNENWTK